MGERKMEKVKKEINYDEELEKLSTTLFNKPVKDIKYLMVTNYVHKNLIEGESCLRTGLYSWIPVFNGDVKHYSEIVDKKQLKEYDIIHVNLSGQDMHLLGEIKSVLGKDSKTKLIANNDYTVELWQSSFDYMPTIKRELEYADVLFGTEPNQVGTLEILTGRNIHLIVHPCFVKRLKSLSKPVQKDVISVVWHRYDNYAVVPGLAIKDLGKKTRLIGYDPNGDKKKYVTSCHYNEILSGTNYMDFTEQLSESKVVVDPFTLTSQSRTGWDCAAMGIPMVGSNRNYSVQRCFPKTMVSPFNAKEMRAMVKKLLDDEEFRKEVIDYAQKEVEIVNYENSKSRYLEALEKGSPKLEI